MPAPTDRSRPTLKLPGQRIAAPELPRGLRDLARSAGDPLAGDPFLPPGFVRPVDAVDLSATARGLADTGQTLAPAAGQVLAIELSEGVTVYTSPENLQRTLAQVAPEAVQPDGSLQLDRLETRAAATRGLRDAEAGAATQLLARVTTLAVGQVGDAITQAASGRLRDWLGDRLTGEADSQLGVTWWGTKALMWAIEDRHGRTHGLYRWAGGEAQPGTLFAPDNDPRLAREAAQGPVLVFIHGTASSVGGSFGDLQGGAPDTWRALELQYGERIYGFEHRSLSESPIENALQLARALPQGARLHLVTHSRGGQVGDLMCLAAREGAELDALLQGHGVDAAALGGLDEDQDRADRDRLQQELSAAYEQQRAALRELVRLLQTRQFTIERYVRVACPARGTRLASGNFDVFLSGLLSLIGLVPGLAGSPWYMAFKRVVLEIAKNRTRPQRVPGIEAMLPGSPMARLLARMPAQKTMAMAVIAGDVEGGGLLKRLGLLFTDHMLFNGVDNDLVVDTDSMSAGVARPATTRRLFDQGAEVNHFRYFTNGLTREALRQWLTVADPGALGQFSPLPALAPERSAEETRRRDAARAAQRGLAPATLPVVIVLPGVMGSHLWVHRRDRVWMDPLDLLAGGLEKVAFGQPGVSAEKLFDMSYGDLCEHLAASHQVERFAYDWRQPLDVLADAFIERVRAVLDASAEPQRPVRVVAHSMGGLVVRALIARQPRLWDELMGRPGARFVMLGTPHHGSHQMVEMLIGKGDTVRMLAHADFRHSLQQVLDLVGGFRGPLALLPRPGFQDEAQIAGGADQQLPDYFQPAVWTRFAQEMKDPWFGNGVVARLDPAALEQGRWLWDQAGPAPALPAAHTERTFYVHGVAASTPCGIVRRNGRWQMLSTPHGDGTVSWPSGKLHGGVAAYYYLPASHGALADTPDYFDAIASLISDGQPGNLLTSPPRVRDATGAEAPAVLAYDAGPPLMPSQEELAAGLLRRAPRAPAPSEGSGPRALTVRVRNDDLRALDRPILVGHYEQDALVGPEALIDRELVDGALRQRYDLGLYAGRVGTATVVLPPPNPMQLARGHRPGAVVAGLGPFDGSLGVPTLTAAVRNAVTRMLLQMLDRGDRPPEDGAGAGIALATLLIGYSTAANLGIGDVLGALIRGTTEANVQFHESTGSPWHVAELDIVELYRDTAISAARQLERVAATLSAGRALRWRIQVAPLWEGEGARERLLDARGFAYWSRLLIGSAAAAGDDDAAVPASGPAPADGADNTLPPPPQPAAPRRGMASRLRFLYLGSGRARVEAQVQQRQPGLVERLVEQQLRQPRVDEAFGRTLFQLMVPNALKDVVRQADRAVLVLDGSTANLPWEMMRVDGQPLATRAALVRQLSTLQYSAQVHQASGRRALVLGNPSCAGFGAAFTPPGQPALPDPDPLGGAENEARGVADVLRQAAWEPTAMIGQEHRALPIINTLLGQPWRMLHIAAHGVVDMPHPDGNARSGVVLSDGLLITAAEVAAMPAVPELVFLNCCHLGQTDLEDGAPALGHRNRLAASLARELIQAGVRAVVVAGWAVDDAAAELFARSFYTALLVDRLGFGDAVFEARKAAHARHPASTTWGAYQAYGDPGWRFSGDGGERPRGGNPASEALPRLHSPVELVNELQQRRRDMKRQTQQLTPSAIRDAASWVQRRLDECQAWAARADVAAAASRLLADLGPDHFGAAIALLEHALTHGSGLGLDAVEQLANLEALHGEAQENLAMVDRAIQRLGDLVTLAGGRQAQARAGMAGVTAERASILGSAYKRRAGLLAREGRTADMADSLRQSLAWYRAAMKADQPIDQSADDHPYSVLNWLALAAWDPALAPDLDAKAQLLLAQRCAAAANRHFSVSRNFWDAVMAADAQWTLALLKGELGGADAQRAVTALHTVYNDALDGLMLPLRAMDGVVRQLHLLADFYAARAALGGPTAAVDHTTAGALRTLGERLQPGSRPQPAAQHPAPPHAARAKPAAKKAPATRTAGAKPPPREKKASARTPASPKTGRRVR